MHFKILKQFPFYTIIQLINPQNSHPYNTYNEQTSTAVQMINYNEVLRHRDAG